MLVQCWLYPLTKTGRCASFSSCIRPSVTPCTQLISNLRYTTFGSLVKSDPILDCVGLTSALCRPKITEDGWNHLHKLLRDSLQTWCECCFGDTTEIAQFHTRQLRPCGCKNVDVLMLSRGGLHLFFLMLVLPQPSLNIPRRGRACSDA